MHYLLVGLTTIVFCLNVGLAFGGSSIQRESLRDLPGVAVIIEEIAADAKADGLSEELIRAAVERSLQSSGIQILTPEERSNTPSKPSLYVRVATYKVVDPGLYVYAVTAALKQSVVLAHRPQRKMFASTWEEGLIGTPGANNIKKTTDVVEELVKGFANDFLAVNKQEAIREEK